MSLPGTLTTPCFFYINGIEHTLNSASSVLVNERTISAHIAAFTCRCIGNDELKECANEYRIFLSAL